MEEQARLVARLLKVLANENRLLILCALLERPMTVGEVGQRVPGITQPALSQHLALLKSSGLLDCQKHGQRITYWISDPRLSAVLDVLKREYCR